MGRQKETVGRFAPTPSGRMHLGNLLCALLAWLSARKDGGRVILRIEDLDVERAKPAYTRQLLKDLLLLGLTWDEGGLAAGEPGPYCQSQRTAYYEGLLQKRQCKGLLYPCFCSRAELHAASAPHASDGELMYSGKCRQVSPKEAEKLAEKRPPALRLVVPDREIAFQDGHYGEIRQNLQKECGDFILRRSDGVFAYQLAVVADDAAMGVTQVVRGRDLLSSTPRQLYLYELLGFAPPAYFHTPLLLAPDGRRLSKRDGDISLSALLEKGFSPRDITGRLACCAGLLPAPRPVSPQELLPLFSWDKVPKEDIRLPAGLFERP